MRLSRTRIQEFLYDWLGLALSIGTINRCLHEAGRAVAPLEDQLVEGLLECKILNCDETTWKEAGLTLWLWLAFQWLCAATAPHQGPRSRANQAGTPFAAPWHPSQSSLGQHPKRASSAAARQNENC